MPQTPTGRAGNTGWIATVLAALVIALVYFGLPNFRYLNDGLVAALRMRDASPWFVHPNHPVHPLVPLIIYRALGGQASGLSELELLTMWSILCGIIACVGLMTILRAGSTATAAIVLGLGLFAFSNGVWYFFVTANPSSTALTFQILALIPIAIAIRRRPDGPTVGDRVAIVLLTALAILAGQINAMLLLPACYAVTSGDIPTREKSGRAVVLLVMVVIVTAAMFYLVGALFAGVRTPSGFLDWQHSYVFERRWWVHGLLDAIRRNWVGAVSVHVASAFDSGGLFGSWLDGFGTPARVAGLLIKLGQAIVLLFLIVETIRAVAAWAQHRPLIPIQIIGLLSAVPIILFSCFWTPDTIHYRILYVPGYLLFLIPSVERHYRLEQFRFRRAWPVVLVLICLFSTNLATRFVPESNPEGNPYRYEMFRLRDSMNPGDIIIFSGSDEGRSRELYARYFLDVDTMLVNDIIGRVRSDPDGLAATLRAHYESGGILLVHEDALLSDEDVEIMNQLYGTDIRPGEFADFMQTWTTLASHFMIDQYYLFEPKE